MKKLFRKNKILAALKETHVETSAEKRHTVLIVDDEPLNLTMLSSLLSESYHVLQASNGREALDLLEREACRGNISLVLSDQRMPHLTGVELFERILPVMPAAKRIILTGYTDVDAVVDCINRVQIHKFMTKPIEPHELLLTVERALELYDAQMAIEEHHKTLEVKVEARTRELAEKNAELQTAYELLEQKNKALQDLNEKLQLASLTDSLTGLHNRRYLFQTLGRDLAPAMHCSDGEPKLARAAFLLIDLDFFKSVNDRWGHAAGDQVLVQTAELLRLTSRDSDVIVRWGGEEFLIVSRDVTRSEACQHAERIRAEFARHAFELEHGEPLSLTCSIGVSTFPFVPDRSKGLSWEQVLAVADRALYDAKNSGRNRWCAYFGQPSLALDARLDTSLDDLISRGHIQRLTAGMATISSKQ